MIASTLATFNISKAKDENGNEIDIDPDAFTDSFTRCAAMIFVNVVVTYSICEPLPFKCSILPRSQQAVSLIHPAANVARQNLRSL